MTVRRAAVVGILAAAAVGGVIVWFAVRSGPVPANPEIGVKVPPGPHVPHGEIDAGIVVPNGPPEGEETVSGRVVGADGAGIPGAVVIAERDVAFDSAIRGRRGDAGVVPIGAPRGAKTGDDGAFAITGLAKGVYRVRVEGPGLVPAELRRVLAPATDVNLVVARIVQVAGVVMDEPAPAGGAPAGGAPVPIGGATVELTGTALPAPRQTTTGPDGRFEVPDLPEGSFVITAWHAARAASPVALARFGGGPWQDVTLLLGPATLVNGRVVDERTGAGVAGARVTLLPESGAARFTLSDAEGNYAIEGVAPGSWSVDVDAAGYLPTEPRSIEAAPGMTVRVDLVLTPGTEVAGRVVDRLGVPVAGARIELTGRDQAGPILVSAETLALRLSRGQPQAPTTSGRLLPMGELGVLVGPIPYPPPPGARVATAAPTSPTVAPGPAPAPDPLAALVQGFVTDAAGQFHIVGVPRGRFVVTATHPEFAAGNVAVVVGRDPVDDVVITMRRGVVVSGIVSDANGAPILGADVSARVGKGTVALAYTDSDGHYELRGLIGAVTLRAAARGQVPVEQPTVFTLDDDGRSILRDFRLGSAGAQVGGIVQDGIRRPIAGAQVTALGDKGVSGQATTDTFGRFTVRGLPDGPVTLQVQHPDYSPATGTARTGRDDVQITLAPAGGLEGQVRDAHGGGPMLSFTISARGPAGAEVVRSFEKGDFSLVPIVPGRWTLTIVAPGYATRVVAFDIPPAREAGQASVTDVRIDLRQGGTLAGIVYDEHGDVVSGALVQAGLVRATSDSAGRFRLTGVEPGDIVVHASHPQLGQGETEVALRSGDEIVTLELKLAP